MKNRRHSARKLPFLIASALALTAAPVALAQSPAPLKVITSGGFSAAFKELQPEFEKASGIKVAVSRGASQGRGPETIGAQLGRGVPADVVIMSREGLDDLIADNKIVAGSDINLGQTPLGLSVRAGAPSRISARSKLSSAPCWPRSPSRFPAAPPAFIW